jgi:hypothetical protein
MNAWLLSNTDRTEASSSRDYVRKKGQANLFKQLYAFSPGFSRDEFVFGEIYERAWLLDAHWRELISALRDANDGNGLNTMRAILRSVGETKHPSTSETKDKIDTLMLWKK